MQSALKAIENIEQENTTFCLIIDAVRHRDLSFEIFERALYGKNNYQLVLIATKEQRDEIEKLIPAGNVKVLTRPVRRNALKYYLNVTETNHLGGRETSPDSTFNGRRLSESKAALPLAPQTRLRALVADDNKLNQQVARLLLEALNIDVELVENGMEAVAAFDGSNYDLVFLDCQMPELDGYAATRIIKRLQAQRAEKTPIIAMTANALEGSREDCLAAGMDDYMAKPIEPAELERVIKIWSAREKIGKPREALQSNTEPPVPQNRILSAKEHKVENEAIIDYATLLGRFNEKNTKQLLGMFAESARDEVAGLETQFTAADYTKLKAAAHAFKGACATICAPGLAANLQKLEEASLLSDNEQCRLLLDQINSKVESALAEVKAHLA